MHITVLLEATITISEVFLECVMLAITFMTSDTNRFHDVSFVSWFEMFIKISFYFLVRGLGGICNHHSRNCIQATLMNTMPETAAPDCTSGTLCPLCH